MLQEIGASKARRVIARQKARWCQNRRQPRLVLLLGHYRHGKAQGVRDQQITLLRCPCKVCMRLRQPRQHHFGQQTPRPLQRIKQATRQARSITHLVKRRSYRRMLQSCLCNLRRVIGTGRDDRVMPKLLQRLTNSQHGVQIAQRSDRR